MSSLNENHLKAAVSSKGSENPQPSSSSFSNKSAFGQYKFGQSANNDSSNSSEPPQPEKSSAAAPPIQKPRSLSV